MVQKNEAEKRKRIELSFNEFGVVLQLCARRH